MKKYKLGTLFLILSIFLSTLVSCKPTKDEVISNLVGLTFKYHDDQGTNAFYSDVDYYIEILDEKTLFYKATGFYKYSGPNGKIIYEDEEE